MVGKTISMFLVMAYSLSALASEKSEMVKVKTVENILQVGAADVLIQECKDSITRLAQKKNTQAIFCADGVFVCRRAIALAKAIKTDDPDTIKFFKNEFYQQIKNVIPLLEKMVATCK